MTSAPGAGAAQVGRDERRTWAAPVFTVAVLATMLTTVTVREGHSEFPGPALLIFTIVAWLPLVVRTRRPVPVLAAVVVAECLNLAIVPFAAPGLETPIAMGAYQPVPLATMAAVWTVASRTPRVIGWTTGIGAAVTLLVVSLLTRPHTLLATDMVMFNLVIIATATGAVVAGRRERARQAVLDRRDEAYRLVVAERLRIARDLHDVLAHHLTLVNAQAGVAGYLMRTDLPAATTALQDISRHTRHALDELRATVGLLRQEGEPEDRGEALHPVPGLDRLPELLAGFRSAGATISLAETGELVPLPAGTDLAAYRIVQEALTNAAKHAPGAHIDVAVHRSPHRLELTVTNAPPPDRLRSHRAPGTGHGLIGMRERAHTCGGSLRLTPGPDGGFAVSATLPLRDDNPLTPEG